MLVSMGQDDTVGEWLSTEKRYTKYKYEQSFHGEWQSCRAVIYFSTTKVTITENGRTETYKRGEEMDIKPTRGTLTVGWYILDRYDKLGSFLIIRVEDEDELRLVFLTNEGDDGLQYRLNVREFNRGRHQP